MHTPRLISQEIQMDSEIGSTFPEIEILKGKLVSCTHQEMFYITQAVNPESSELPKFTLIFSLLESFFIMFPLPIF